MIKVKIITLGRLKEEYLRQASGEYQKRLSRFCDLEIIEIPPASLPENPSKSQIDAALNLEAEMIEKKIPKDFFVSALCIEGKPLSSTEFAEKLCELSSVGKNICFIIGSSYGLSGKIKEKADLRLSLSKMTFPHQLFRIMLLEQIYRCFMINDGTAYHK